MRQLVKSITPTFPHRPVISANFRTCVAPEWSTPSLHAMKIAEVRAYPDVVSHPGGKPRRARHRHRGQARRGDRQGDDRRRPRRLGRSASRPRAHGASRKLIETTLQQLVLGMDADRRGRHLGPDVPLPAREPRHGRGRLPRDERHRHGAVGHPRQGAWAGRSTSCSAAAAKPIPAYAGGVSLGYQAADAAGRRSRTHRRRGLQGDQAARRRFTVRRDIERMRAVRKAFGDEHRDPDRRQHRLHAWRTCAA